jgi:hypothetical protein
MRFVICSVIVTLLMVDTLFAQVTAIQQSESVRRQQDLQTAQQKTTQGNEEKAPELYPGENADVGPQFLLRVKQRREWVEGSVDSQYFYTSNVFLSENPTYNSTVDTGVWVNTAQVAFAPTPFDWNDGKLAPRVGFRHQWYNYGLDKNDNNLNNIDFDLQTIFAEVRYQFAENWVASFGTDFTRLLQHETPVSDYAEIYKEIVPRGSVERFFPLNDTMFFNVAYDTAYHITETDPFPSSYSNNRWDHNITGSFGWEIMPNLWTQPYYRFQLTDYWGNGSRYDFLYTFGLGFSFNLAKWASLRTFVAYDIKESHDNPESNTVDYKNLNAGLGLNLLLRF